MFSFSFRPGFKIFKHSLSHWSCSFRLLSRLSQPDLMTTPLPALPKQVCHHEPNLPQSTEPVLHSTTLQSLPNKVQSKTPIRAETEGICTERGVSRPLQVLGTIGLTTNTHCQRLHKDYINKSVSTCSHRGGRRLQRSILKVYVFSQQEYKQKCGCGKSTGMLCMKTYQC